MKSDRVNAKRVPLLDLDIRSELRRRLECRYRKSSDTVILDEFGCIDARIDMAVVNGRLHGYEIKSDRDNLDRLVTQAPAYSSVFDCMTVVVGSKHAAKVVNRVPEWWEVVEATRSGARVILKTIRKPMPNTSLDPVALSRMIWRNEAYAVLRRRDLHRGLRRASVVRLRNELLRHLTVDELAHEVRRAIKDRDRSEADEPQVQRGDSSPIRSTTADYQANLDWLLSLRFSRPQR